MSDLFNDFNKIFKKDLVPIVIKYLKDPNNKITDNLNDFLSDPQIVLTKIFEKLSINKDYDNNLRNYVDIENVTDNDPSFDDEYADLLKHLISIEKNMIQIEKILKDKN
tara:strand:+ start:836 stop:1162 length:327 start_codon:yes stop_codon:yes gene_type:complete